MQHLDTLWCHKSDINNFLIMNKKNTAFSFVILILTLFTCPHIVHAAEIRGAEIQWEHLSAQKYKISLNYYRDCRGSAAEQTKTLKIFCGRGIVTDTFYLDVEYIVFKDITPACLTNTNPCGAIGNTDSAGNGLEKHVYQATIDFGSGLLDTMQNKGCCVFRFYFEECCRSASLTTIGANTFFAIDAEIELCNLRNSYYPDGDNSPEFRNDPVVNLCCNQAVALSNGVIDIDGDSLAFSLVPARKSDNSDVTYSTLFNSGSWPMTGYCRKTAPCNCRPGDRSRPTEGFCFEPELEMYKFHPTACDESGLLVIRVEQYRLDTLANKWLYVGYTKRELNLQISATNCADNNPPFIKDAINPSICEGENVCMTIKVEDDEYIGGWGAQSWKDTIELSWNNGLPNATFAVGDPYFVFQNGVTTSVREAQVCWQTKLGDGREAPYFFSITARDKACPNNGVSSRTFAVQVKRSAKIGKTVAIKNCDNYAIDINHANIFTNRVNTQYDWYITDTSGKTILNSNKQIDHINLPLGTYYLNYYINNPPLNCPSTGVDTINITSAPYNVSALHPNMTVLSDTGQCLQGNLFKFIDDSKIDLGSITEYFWDFGDGDTAYGKTVNKRYDSAGTYTVRLQITSNFGCVSHIEKKVIVFAKPTSFFTCSDTVACSKNPVFEFYDKSTTANGIIISSFWDFGDGSNANMKNPKKSFSNVGEYEITQVVTDNKQCKDTSIMWVRVAPSPNAKPIVGNALASNSRSLFKYSTPLQFNHTFFWIVPNGKIIFGQNTRMIDVLWQQFGWTHVSYVITNADGCKDTANLAVYVTDTSKLGVQNIGGVEVKLYPNPVKDLLYLKTDKPIQTVKVFDSKGSLLVEERENTEFVDFSRLPIGVYMVYIQDVDGYFVVGKVFKE